MRYCFGDHTLDTTTHQLIAGSTEIELEPQVFAVLAHLVRNRDRMVSKEELLDAVWGSRFVSESTLTTRIKQVRRAVGDTGRDQRVVRTVHGRGYRFVAPVDDPRRDRAPVPRRTVPPTRYADSQGASIAFQTFGEGPDIVLIAGFATNVEAQWDHPAMADFLTRLGDIGRITVLDKRGVGLSERMPHDNVPPLETRADDLAAVLDAAGIERAILLGSSEGGSLSAVFAAGHPERVDRLILHNTWVTGPEFRHSRPRDLDLVFERWGTGRISAYLAPSLVAAPGGLEAMARYERQSATPRAARHLAELLGQIDIAGILGAIAVPTLVLHRADDRVVPLDNGRELAASIPGARLVVLDGRDHYLFSGDPTQTLAAIREFVTGSGARHAAGERVLATVVFVEVTGSANAPGSGDGLRPAGPFREFSAVACDEVRRQRGRVVSTSGGGLVAVFDGPGRAVRAAGAVRDALRSLGLSPRAGVHTAEIQVRDDEIAGIGVDIAECVADAARSGEVWVSRTVTDLVAGTGLRFQPQGEHVLGCVDEPWQLFTAVV